MTSTRKQAPNLSSVTAHKTYQVRVKTGNLVMDKIAFEFAHDAFGKYLVLSREEPYTGYIDITFTSSLQTPFTWPSLINWAYPFRWSKPEYQTNVAYGNAWYTGNDKIGTKGISQFTETGINPDNALTWHNGKISVTLKDMEKRKLWSADYEYKGGWNPTRAFYIYSAEGAVKQCILAILEKFETDYIINPEAEKDIREDQEKPGIAQSSHGLTVFVQAGP